MAKLFVTAITPYGAALIGKVSKDSFEQWRKRLEVIKLIQPKRLVMMPGNTQTPDASTARIHIEPAYFGNTDQSVLYLENVSVEVIGEITVYGDEEVCREAPQMFNAYKRAVKEYEERNHKLVSPTMSDIQAVSKPVLTR